MDKIEKLIKKLEDQKKEALETGYELDELKTSEHVGKMAASMSEYLFGRADMCDEVIKELKKLIK